MESLLLHSCCAPCSAAVIEWMLNNDIQPTVYYYNPNIFPREEYEKRKAELTRYCGERGITGIDGDWEHDAGAAVRRALTCGLRPRQKNVTNSVSSALPRRSPQAAGKT